MSIESTFEKDIDDVYRKTLTMSTEWNFENEESSVYGVDF